LENGKWKVENEKIKYCNVRKYACGARVSAGKWNFKIAYKI
jgi:hypothetical protein